MAKMDLPELAEVSTAMESVRLEIAELRAIVRPIHVWWTRRQMAAAKRGIEKRLTAVGLKEFESFYNSIRHQADFWPPEPPKDVGGVMCYHESVVSKWLQMDDAELKVHREAFKGKNHE
jgi:hypothetical protein